MYIAVVILWYLIGYVGMIWVVSRIADVTAADLVLFLLFAVIGPVLPTIFFLFTFESETVVIRRRK